MRSRNAEPELVGRIRCRGRDKAGFVNKYAVINTSLWCSSKPITLPLQYLGDDVNRRVK